MEVLLITPAVPDRPLGLAGGRRSKHDQVRRIEVRVVQQIENFRAKLQVQAFADFRILQHGEIPSSEPRSNIGVSSSITVKTDRCRRRDKRIGIEPLIGIASYHRAGEIGIEKWPDGISRVPAIRRVIAELRGERKSGLGGDNAGNRPPADCRARKAAAVIRKTLAAAEGQFVKDVRDAYMFDIESCQPFVSSQIQRVRNQARSVARRGLIQRISVVQSFGKGINPAQQQSVAKPVTQVHLQ